MKMMSNLKNIWKERSLNNALNVSSGYQRLKVAMQWHASVVLSFVICVAKKEMAIIAIAKARTQDSIEISLTRE